MLKVKNISKCINKADILEDVTFNASASEMLGIMGPSGSGKSSLLSIIGGIDMPSSGHVFINDVDMYAQKSHELDAFRGNNIGFVFQNHNLINELTAYENVIVPLIFNNKAKFDDAHARELLNMMGLKLKADLYPYQLSGGEQQRVSIARALVCRPGLLLADEPTGSLDQKNADSVMEIFLQAIDKYKITVLLVTHDKSVSEKCHRIILLKEGKIHESSVDKT